MKNFLFGFFLVLSSVRATLAHSADEQAAQTSAIIERLQPIAKTHFYVLNLMGYRGPEYESFLTVESHEAGLRLPFALIFALLGADLRAGYRADALGVQWRLRAGLNVSAYPNNLAAGVAVGATKVSHLFQAPLDQPGRELDFNGRSQKYIDTESLMAVVPGYGPMLTNPGSNQERYSGVGLGLFFSFPEVTTLLARLSTPAWPRKGIVHLAALHVGLDRMRSMLLQKDLAQATRVLEKLEAIHRELAMKQPGWVTGLESSYALKLEYLEKSPFASPAAIKDFRRVIPTIGFPFLARAGCRWLLKGLSSI